MFGRDNSAFEEQVMYNLRVLLFKTFGCGFIAGMIVVVILIVLYKGIVSFL